MIKAVTAVGTVSLNRLLAHVRTPLYRNGYALLINSVATSGLGLFYWILAARLYSAEVVGLNSAVLAAMQFLYGIAVLSLSNVLIRYIPLAGEKTLRLVSITYGASIAITLVVGLGFVVGVRWFLPAFGFLVASPASITLFLVALIMVCVFSLQDSVLIGLRQAVWVPVENTLFGLAKIGLLALLVGVSQHYGVLLSWIVPAVLSLAPVNLLIFRWLVPRHVAATKAHTERLILRQIVKYGSSNYAGQVFLLAGTSFLPVLVTSQLGVKATAYFSQPWLLATSLQLVALNLATSLTVEATLDPSRLRADFRRVMVQVAGLLLPMAAVVWFGAPYILRAFGQSYAAEGATLLRWLALAALPHGLIALSLGLARVQRRLAVIVLAQGAQCVLTLSLSYVLMPRYGITGVGIAYLISVGTVAVGLFLVQLRPILFAGQEIAGRMLHPQG
jgi:O-antigen/teichoic acid export membrane protein